MGSNKHLKSQAIALRLKGKSYNTIVKFLGIKSKGTLNSWFKNLKLPKRSKELLEKNNLLAHKRGLFSANKKRSERIKIENDSAVLEGSRIIRNISDEELALIGASLYWAEGMKSQTRTSASLIFSNSDPIMITIYLQFLRKILKTPEIRIRAGIHIYPSISPEDAKKYWSKITGLPPDRFYIVTQISKASQNKRPRILMYGTVSIRVNDRIHFYKVKGMIEGIIKNLTG